jgi:alkylated DNA nucleotide flippase Atl1
MYLHANAKLGLAGRLALVRAIEDGCSLRAAALAFSVSPATAHRWYGDVSVAVRGDTNGARAVGRAAAMLEHFPNPHRVLQSGGQIPEGWRSSHAEEPNPAECRRRLEEEGVEFDEHGRASRRHYVAWDVLVERAEEQQAA